jgi:hypothetical protein
MVLFGDVEDFPVVEILSFVSRYSGALVVTPRGTGQSVKIHIDKGAIRGIMTDGQWLDSLEAHRLLSDLLELREGTFWFDPEAIPPRKPQFMWPIEQVLLELAQATDELALFRSSLPDSNTRFRLSSHAQQIDHLSLLLHAFWEKARPFLERGVTIRTLAEELKLPEETVAVRIHKLRLAGLVEPVRAFRHRPQRLEEVGLFRRLLRALAGRL